MKKITLALSVGYAVFELFAPASAHAFGKPKETGKPAVVKPAAIKSQAAKPAAEVPAAAKTALAKPSVITPVATKTAATPVVAKPVIKPAIKRAAKKPSKQKITAVTKAPPIQAAKPAEPPAAVSRQPTPGQQVGQAVDQGINTVGGLFDKFKTSVKNPVTQSSCSPAQKSMSQC